MPWRLLRRCLLFALLGLVTSVAVAWMLRLPLRLLEQTAGPEVVGLAAKGDTIVRVRVRSSTGRHVELWEFTDNTLDRGVIGPRPGSAQKIAEMGGAAYDEWMEQIERFRAETRAALSGTVGAPPPPPPPEQYRIDDRAERGPPVAVPDLARGETEVWIRSHGWPFLSLRYTGRIDRIMDDSNVEGDRVQRIVGARIVDSRVSRRFGIQLPWGKGRESSLFYGPDTIILPLEPRPGLALNTIFYALLWALLLLAPGAIRRRIRRARGRCPTCGYLLRGQPAPGCPECGHGREAVGTRPQPAAKRQGGPAPA